MICPSVFFCNDPKRNRRLLRLVWPLGPADLAMTPSGELPLPVIGEQAESHVVLAIPYFQFGRIQQICPIPERKSIYSRTTV